LHGNAEHLCLDAAPLPVVSLGPFVDLPMPIGLAAPADFSAIREAVDRGITRLVDVVRNCHRDVARGYAPLPPHERRERESPRGWVETDEESVSISRPAYAAAEFLSATATRLVPEFVSDGYKIEISLRKLDAWLQEAPFDIRLSRRQEGMAFPDFPIEQAADGHRLWLQLALLDALEQIGIIESLIRQRVGEAYGAELELSNVSGEEVLRAQHPGVDVLNQRVQDVLEAFCGTEFSESDPGGELGAALARSPSDEWIRGGTRERRFFLVDEPERHLHPRLQRAAAAWLARTTSARQAPCLVASHSAPFLGLSGKSVSYVHVARENEHINLRPLDPADLKQLDELSAMMGFDRGELLTLVNLWLVVEGLTDKVVLDTLFAKELRSAGIEVVPIHGIAKWQALLDSDALWRFTTASIAVMFDQVPAERINEMTGLTPDMLQAIAKSSSEAEEVKTLAVLLSSIVRQGKTITSIPNSLPDILSFLDEQAVKTVFPKYPGHSHAEEAWQQHNKGKRGDFLRKRYGVDKRSELFRQIAEDMLNRRVESDGLSDIIKRCAELAQQR
jgi:hypothetical protein